MSITIDLVIKLLIDTLIIVPDVLKINLINAYTGCVQN